MTTNPCPDSVGQTVYNLFRDHMRAPAMTLVVDRLVSECAVTSGEAEAAVRACIDQGLAGVLSLHNAEDDTTSCFVDPDWIERYEWWHDVLATVGIGEGDKARLNRDLAVAEVAVQRGEMLIARQRSRLDAWEAGEPAPWWTDDFGGDQW